MLDIVMLEEDDFDARIYIFLDSVLEKYNKICYLTLNSTYDYLKEDFKKQQIPLDKFHFIDVLTKREKKTKNHKNCTYLSGPDIKKILTTIKNAVSLHNCNMILIDNISNMLHYYDNMQVQRLTNLLKENYSKIQKIFFVRDKDELIKDDIINMLKDLTLFADKIIELT